MSVCSCSSPVCQKYGCQSWARIPAPQNWGQLGYLQPVQTGVKPHKCPVCDGSGKRYIDPSFPLSGIEATFCLKDANGRSYEKCNACINGIVWG